MRAEVLLGMKNSRWLSLIVLCTGFLLIVVDMTIVNVALPSIQADLGFSQSGLAWVVNAYLIAFGGLLLLAGRVGDLLGRKRVFLMGLAIFVGASVLCGLSFAQPMLIGARFVQGVGGAVSSAVILGTIVQTSDYGLAAPRTLVLGGVALALLGAFVVRQATAGNPILPLQVFRSRKVAGANVVQALISTSFFSFFFLGSLDMERVLGYGPMAIGLAFLPVAIVMALFSIRFSAQLIARFGAGAMLIAGQAMAGLALLVVAPAPAHR